MRSIYNINRTNVLYTVQIKVRRDKERKVQEGEGTMSEFENLSNAATTGNLKERVNMDWFFKDVSIAFFVNWKLVDCVFCSIWKASDTFG